MLEVSAYVFGTEISWYSIFVLMGAISVFILASYFYKKDSESKKCPDLILDLLLIAFPSGLLGARIWFVLSELDYYMNDPISILKVWEGGLAIQGGVILGAAVGITYAILTMKKKGMTLKITTLMDMIIPNILLAQVIGRWGNFFNKEVYGACVSQEYVDKHWWWIPKFIQENVKGGYYDDGNVISCSLNEYAQPLFLYEGLINLLGFIIISILVRKFIKNRVDGTLSGLYLVWYGAIRASLEGLRNEEFIMRWGNVSQSLVTSILYVIGGVAYIAYLYINDYRKKKNITQSEEKAESETIE